MSHKTRLIAYFACLLFIATLMPLWFEDYRGWILCLWILNIGLLLQFLFRSRDVDFFNPVVLFTFVNIRFLIRPIYWVITGDFDIWGGYMGEEETARYTIFGLLLNLAGVVAYLFGYYSKTSSLFLRKITVLSDVWYRRRFVVLVAACYAIAVAAFLVLVEGAGGLSVMLSNIARRREMFEGKYYLFVAVNLAVISFYVHAGRRLNLTRRLGGSNLLLLLALALSFIFFGGRGQILSIIAIFIMIYHYSVRRIRFWVLAGILVLAITSMVALLEFRQATGGYSMSGDIEEGIVLESAERTVRSMIFFDSFLLALKGIQEEIIPLQWGSTYSALLALPVPRALWERKPALSEDILVWDAFVGSEVRSGIPMGYPGVMFINFHMAGIVVGFLALGVIHSFLYSYVTVAGKNTSAIILYAISIWWLQTGLTNSSIFWWLGYVLPAYFLLKIISCDKLKLLPFPS